MARSYLADAKPAEAHALFGSTQERADEAISSHEESARPDAAAIKVCCALAFTYRSHERAYNTSNVVPSLSVLRMTCSRMSIRQMTGWQFCICPEPLSRRLVPEAGCCGASCGFDVLVLQALEDLRLRAGAWRVVAHAKALEAQEQVQAGVQDLQLAEDKQESELR